MSPKFCVGACPAQGAVVPCHLPMIVAEGLSQTPVRMAVNVPSPPFSETAPWQALVRRKLPATSLPENAIDMMRPRMSRGSKP